MRATARSVVSMVLAVVVWAVTSALVWAPAGSPTRGGAGDALYLADGRVLVLWGEDVYTVSSGAWSSVPPAPSFMRLGALLSDGRVIQAFERTRTTQLFDPTTNTWRTGGMGTVVRCGSPRPVTLANGRVLVSGGDDCMIVGGSSYPTYRSSAEVYDPGADAWTAVASMSSPREYHTMTLLPSGRVLVTGGFRAITPLRSTEIYDPINNTWTNAASMGTERQDHTAVRLADGRVLVVGGLDGLGAVAGASAEIFNETTGLWTSAGSMSAPRETPAAVLMNDGRVIVIGGWSGTADLATTDIFNPTTGAWTPGPTMMRARGTPSAVILPDGRVLVAGGDPVSPPLAEILVDHYCGNGIVETTEQCDDGNTTAGDCCSPTCTIESAGTVCRPANSECDTPESCTGTSGSCPFDAARAAGTACGPAPMGACDAQDTCLGSMGLSAVCASRYRADGTSCAMATCAAGMESSAASCTGSSASCPAVTMRACAPYACGASACNTMCASGADCASGASCVGAACVVIVDAGQDAASPDTGPPDTGLPDTGSVDAAVSVDAASPDAGSIDAATMVVDAASPRDAGLDASADATSADATSTSDAAADVPAPHPACACAIDRRASSALAWMVSMLAIGAVVARRRQRSKVTLRSACRISTR